MRKTVCLALALALLCLIAPAAAQDTPTNWYEVFVYSFSDSNGDGIGDLKGLEGKLDYLAGLGFNGLWLMPVMPSPSYHKYDVTDYRDIDPQYGTLSDMRDLVAACHVRGMRLIIDLPVNHTSTRHPWFLRAAQALREGRDSDPAVAAYRFSKQPGSKFTPLAGTPWYYEEQFTGGNMPDLNLDSPAVRSEIEGILAFWLLDVGVDGFRLDAVTSFYSGDDAQNIAFLRFLKQAAERFKPGSYLVGECWAGLATIARYYESGVDSFFLFPAAQAEGAVAAAMRARRPAEAFAKDLQSVWAAIPQGRLAPFLSNHDTGRTVGLVQGRQAPERVKFAHALLALMGGDTFTYYGEEVGMVGSGADPNKRLGLPWAEGERTLPPPGATSDEYPFPPVDNQQKDPASLLNYIGRLNRLKLALPAVSLGQGEVVLAQGDVLLLRRTLDGQVLLIAVNFESREARALPLPGKPVALHALDVSGVASTLQMAGDGAVAHLEPYGILFLCEEEGGGACAR